MRTTLGQLPRRARALLLVLIGAAAGGGTFAVASVPDTNGTIHACYLISDSTGNPPQTSQGNVRIIDPSAGQTCTAAPAERALAWNVQGIQGPPGDQGPRGPRGFPGNGLTIASPTIKPTDAPIGHGKIGGLTFGVLSVAVARDVSSGVPAGKRQFNQFHITKKSDSASARLFKFCANGKHLDRAVITARKAGGDPKKLVRYTLTHVVINGFDTVATGGKGSTPEESISFSFNKIKVEYVPQKPDGSG